MSSGFAVDCLTMPSGTAGLPLKRPTEALVVGAELDARDVAQAHEIAAVVAQDDVARTAPAT